MRFVVVSGLSGSGKSTALKALEEAGFFVSDNLPPELWHSLYDQARSHGLSKVAICTDARTRSFLESVEHDLADLLQQTEAQVVFLDASDEVLLGRYNLTRRAHPMGDVSLFADFQREREILAPLREAADLVIDTTELSAKQLAERITETLHLEADFTLRIFSFGFKHGPPRDADLVLDMRGLPNPYYDARLKSLSGLDPQVAEYVLNGQTRAFYLQLRDFVRASAELARSAKRRNYTVGIGCTGGRHRSVAIAERLVQDLSDLGARRGEHRDIHKGEY
ncbi:UPF0042 nucleotide-binding protein [Deinobacterium chartae]|uniref:UPF0042 nucleotide-binding protein n=1 Tax=Deinobacterium chartae TaxID=521158 RepID=A0A841I093_9DEIO|nr:RNase adapter RapZ [Deinobacterium chartae]MBB6097542.1 UPF0042 nucleotide-binding protein [Deinobacterium chartae]